MNDPKKSVPKTPHRLSAGPVEEQKPSRVIAVFWWVVFIVPLVLIYVTSGSLLLIGILVVVRVAIMFIPFGKKDKKKAVKAPAPSSLNTGLSALVGSPAQAKKTGNSYMPFKTIFTPLIEEAKDEWRWLMKFLRIYDHEREDRYLDDYRKLRGWGR